MVDQVRLFKIKSRWVGSVYKKIRLNVSLKALEEGSEKEVVIPKWGLGQAPYLLQKLKKCLMFKTDGDGDSSEAESEWTWETCSESEGEELEKDKEELKSSAPLATTLTMSSTTSSIVTEKKAIPTYPTWMRTTGLSQN